RDRSVVVAHSIFIRSGAAQRMGAHRAASFVSDYGSPVLVGLTSRPARRDGLRRGGALCVYNLDSQRRLGSFDNVRRLGLVSLIQRADRFVGIHAARGPATRRFNYVD